MFVLASSAIIWFCVDTLGKPFEEVNYYHFTTFSFLLGAATSMACGAFGMHIATFSNYRTTICARISLGYAFKCAYRAGVVVGFTLVAVSLLMLFVLIQMYQSILDLDFLAKTHDYYNFLFEAVAGFGLGGSTVALFARVGGGIFTKAADLGSDLVGKV